MSTNGLGWLFLDSSSNIIDDINSGDDSALFLNVAGLISKEEAERLANIDKMTPHETTWYEKARPFSLSIFSRDV